MSGALRFYVWCPEFLCPMPYFCSISCHVFASRRMLLDHLVWVADGLACILRSPGIVAIAASSGALFTQQTEAHSSAFLGRRPLCLSWSSSLTGRSQVWLISIGQQGLPWWLRW